MNSALGLLQAIIESPDDDDLRLIYADLMEDTDPARAQLIRAQIELLRLPPKPRYFRDAHSFSFWRRRGGVSVPNEDQPILEGERIDVLLEEEETRDEFDELYKQFWPGLLVLRTRHERNYTYVEFRVDEKSIPWKGQELHHTAQALLKDHKLRWLAELGLNWEPANQSFQRGFLETVSADLEALLHELPRLVQRAPILGVDVTDRRPGGLFDSGFLWTTPTALQTPHQGLIRHDLPGCLAKGLVVGTRSVHRGVDPSPMTTYVYDTRALALQAVSGALLDWARSQKS